MAKASAAAAIAPARRARSAVEPSRAALPTRSSPNHLIRERALVCRATVERREGVCVSGRLGGAEHHAVFPLGRHPELQHQLFVGSELIRRKVQNVRDENFTREEASFDLTHWLSVGSPEQRGADWGFSAIEAGGGPDADFRNNARRVVDDLLDGEAGPHGTNGVDNFT